MSRHRRRRRGDPVAPRPTATTAAGRPPAQGDDPDGYAADGYAADGYAVDDYEGDDHDADYGIRRFDDEDFGTGYFAAADGHGYGSESGREVFGREDRSEYDREDGPADDEGRAYGPEGYGSEDYGSEDYGSEDYGSEDYGHQDVDGPGPGWDAEPARAAEVPARGRLRRDASRTAAQVLTTDLAERVKPGPFEGTEMWAAVAGTVVWAVLFVASLVLHGTLSNSGRGWWTYTCVAGVGVGLLGVYQIRRRRMAGSLRGADGDDDGAPGPSPEVDD